MSYLPSKPIAFPSEEVFNEWYNREIVPLFRNAVEVVGYIGLIDGVSSPIVTKKGIFISADLLSSPSAEDLLGLIVNEPDVPARLKMVIHRFLEKKK